MHVRIGLEELSPWAPPEKKGQNINIYYPSMDGSDLIHVTPAHPAARSSMHLIWPTRVENNTFNLVRTFPCSSTLSIACTLLPWLRGLPAPCPASQSLTRSLHESELALAKDSYIIFPNHNHYMTIKSNYFKLICGSIGLF